MDALALNSEQKEHDLDKDQEVQDRFYLMCWGLKQKAALKRRKFLFKVTAELKRRFKKLLYMY
jgi:hypothetical protein